MRRIVEEIRRKRNITNYSKIKVNKSISFLVGYYFYMHIKVNNTLIVIYYTRNTIKSDQPKLLHSTA